MPARDLFHDAVKAALIKDGWTVTHDPLRLQWGPKDLDVDLGAEKLLAAEKGERRIAVEVKTFLGRSDIADLENALGQYTLYDQILTAQASDRELFLAVRELAFTEIFEEPVGRLLLENGLFRLLVFDEEEEVILRWLP